MKEQLYYNPNNLSKGEKILVNHYQRAIEEETVDNDANEAYFRYIRNLLQAKVKFSRGGENYQEPPKEQSAETLDETANFIIEYVARFRNKLQNSRLSEKVLHSALEKLQLYEDSALDELDFTGEFDLDKLDDLEWMVFN